MGTLNVVSRPVYATGNCRFPPPENAADSLALAAKIVG
jgi:hypothetical protein